MIQDGLINTFIKTLPKREQKFINQKRNEIMFNKLLPYYIKYLMNLSKDELTIFLNTRYIKIDNKIPLTNIEKEIIKFL